jgi:hypothetical protein
MLWPIIANGRADNKYGHKKNSKQEKFPSWEGERLPIGNIQHDLLDPSGATPSPGTGIKNLPPESMMQTKHSLKLRELEHTEWLGKDVSGALVACDMRDDLFPLNLATDPVVCTCFIVNW